MAKVIWSPDALDDLDAVAAYIARDSADQAALFAWRVIEAVDALAVFPRMGRPAPEMRDPDWRQVIVGAYRVIYRVVGDAVRIEAVVHGARQWRPRPA